MKVFSVVIPTYNSEKILSYTLESLIQQSLDVNQFEVIVCDDGSSDNTKECVKSYRSQLDIHYLFQEDKGFRAARARNMGLNKAVGKNIFFLDSGVILERAALQQHATALSSQSHDINIGFCHGFEEFESTENEYLKLIELLDFVTVFKRLSGARDAVDCRQRLLKEIGHKNGFIAHPWLMFWGGHLSCSTELLKSVDGFDEKFTRWGGEDVELGLRLYREGHRFSLLEDALAYHIPHQKVESATPQTSHDNCHYIHNKHQLALTRRMLTEDWQTIIRSVA
ncbi:glycosyltransferase [Aliikangiella coralliicola]|uniref:Glycosyltransferase n=1 Tax=Aliikangiella coralliicola TaxID=2592383 RepID=A0A545UCY3_9GAMM|nr:glycosyltransferase [Aliikangiella coralliicola]TQV87327.1 glycosyltransferase [Aliikangiella coralliicola]